MLARKKVVVGSAHLHVWDEANNFLGSFHKREDEAMCRFLIEMIDRRFYVQQPEAEALPGLPA